MDTTAAATGRRPARRRPGPLGPPPSIAASAAWVNRGTGQRGEGREDAENGEGHGPAFGSLLASFAYPFASPSLEPAETTFAAGVVAQGGVQRGTVEVGPALFGHPQLGIGDLPEQEVADAHLA